MAVQTQEHKVGEIKPKVGESLGTGVEVVNAVGGLVEDEVHHVDDPVMSTSIRIPKRARRST
jgi:hypothetical protein